MEEALFICNSEVDSCVGWAPKGELLDIKHLCDTIHDSVDYDSLEDMISSTKWWKVGSRPPKGVAQSFFSVVLRTGADWLEDLRPERTPGKVLQAVRINNDHVPDSVKFVDT
eukprot:5640799-Karenia_brevis.AAC.1